LTSTIAAAAVAFALHDDLSQRNVRGMLRAFEFYTELQPIKASFDLAEHMILPSRALAHKHACVHICICIFVVMCICRRHMRQLLLSAWPL